MSGIAFVSGITSGERVERKYFATYVNLGDSITGSGTPTPNWHLVGARVEDAAMEFNAEVEESADILGNSYAEYSKQKPSMAMEPYTLLAGDALQLDILTKLYNDNLAGLETYEVMNVWGFLTDGTTTSSSDGKLLAKVYQSCTISPQSVGGSSNVDMPITINYGGNIVRGTVNAISASPTFTAAAS